MDAVVTSARDSAIVAKRLTAQQLAGPQARTAVDVVRHLLAVQAQDPRGARLAIRARSTGLRATDVDRALDNGELVVSWLNRGTLHLVRSEDYWWLHALTTPSLATGNARRLMQEGVDPSAAERGVTVIIKTIEMDGPQTRAQLRERVAAAGVRTQGQAIVHLLGLATLRGHVVRGPMVGTEQAFVLVRDWLGDPPPLDRDRALAELTRRYLASHGPATEADLAKWTGLGLRDVRRGLKLVGGEVAQDGSFAALRTAAEAQPLPAPRLLGAYDPLLHGWVSREPILGPHRSIVTVNGLFRPFALVNAKAAATWGLDGGKVTLNPLEPLSPDDAAALTADSQDVLRFLSPEPPAPPSLRRAPPARGQGSAAGAGL